MIYVIVGPTGSGKTSIATSIASIFHLPIINADAFQIYKDMDIGTAKINKDDPLYKSHYLLDILEPSSVYSVKQYQDDFNKIIYKLIDEYKDVIICGGTGLYIKAALYDYNFPDQEEIDDKKYDSFTNEELYELLNKIDPESAKNIHVNNRKRLIRALLINESGYKKSENISSQKHELKFNKDEIKILFLSPDRDELYKNINERVDKMFALGLVDEVKSLLNKYDLSLTAKQAIGYKEVIDYLNKELSLEECKELIKKRSRNYAKRQITFFKHQFECETFATKDQLEKYLVSLISNKNNMSI